MEVFACRDVSNFDYMLQLREIIESTSFHCKVSAHPFHKVGILRIEYRSHDEKEICDCDLKLSAEIISFLETKGNENPVLLPLEFGVRWFLWV